MNLVIENRAIRVWEVAPGFVVFHEPIDLPPSSGQIVLQLDGERHSWPVRLPEGALATSPRAVLG
jgi:hypothetical protein